MKALRRRLSPDESRAAAIAAARELLLEAGPQAVTLKAVAGRIGRTHANVLHHFGTAAGLQSELAKSISDSVTAGIAQAVIRARQGEADPREVVDKVFDAFGREGAGALAAWLILMGDKDALKPVLEAIHNLVDELGQGHDDRPVHETTLWLVITALGDSLLGSLMADALGLPRDSARAIARHHLIAAAGTPE